MTAVAKTIPHKTLLSVETKIHKWFPHWSARAFSKTECAEMELLDPPCHCLLVDFAGVSGTLYDWQWDFTDEHEDALLDIESQTVKGCTDTFKEILVLVGDLTRDEDMYGETEDVE